MRGRAGAELAGVEGGRRICLEVLGTSSPYPGPGRACPGYLVSYSGVRLLVECGSGVAANLAAPGGLSGFERVDAVLLSHLHGDHMSDMLVVKYAMYRSISLGWRGGPLPVYAPEEPEEVFRLLDYKDVVQSRKIKIEGTGAGRPQPETIRFGEMLVRFRWMSHPVPTLGMRFEAGGRALAYSADTSRCDALLDLAAGADLFLCEASFSERERGGPGHLSAREAAEVASECGVKKLVLTHIWPGFDRGQLLADAAGIFPEVEVAEEGRRYSV